MLIFEMTITLGEEWEQDEQGNDYTVPINEKFVIKASQDNLRSLLRGIRRILDNGLADECYVRLVEQDRRMSYIGSVFNPLGFDGADFDYMMEHHEKVLSRVLALQGT